MRTWALVLAILHCGAIPAGAAAGLAGAQQTLDAALSGTNAIAVVVDAREGRLIAAVRVAEAAQLASSPGSTLKPLFLAAALRHGIVRGSTTVVCQGDLRIAGRDLACTHPREVNVLDAERALAYSCNTWFASLARRFVPEQAAGVLREYGFGSQTDTLRQEAAGVVRTPPSEAELQLMVLGLEGVAVTPIQLARAYFRLSEDFDEAPIVRRGLEGSVVYGMAHNAATPGLIIAGKTGTASDAGEAWTNGWFAGIASRGVPPVVVVIYVPRGNGADAAALAHRFFAAWERTTP